MVAERPWSVLPSAAKRLTPKLRHYLHCKRGCDAPAFFMISCALAPNTFMVPIAAAILIIMCSSDCLHPRSSNSLFACFRCAKALLKAKLLLLTLGAHPRLHMEAMLPQDRSDGILHRSLHPHHIRIHRLSPHLRCCFRIFIITQPLLLQPGWRR